MYCIDLQDKINAFTIEKTSILSLTCPAQGHPLPAFRFVNFLLFLLNTKFRVYKSAEKNKFVQASATFLTESRLDRCSTQ